MNDRIKILLLSLLLATGCGTLDKWRGKADDIGAEVKEAKDKAEKIEEVLDEGIITEDVTGQPETPEPIAEVLPWGDWGNIKFVGMHNIADAPIVTRVSNVRVGGSVTTWDQTEDRPWPKHSRIKNKPNGVLNLAFEKDGQWYMVPTEWLLAGMHHQSNKIYASDRENKPIWKDALRHYKVGHGDKCAIVITDKWGDATERSGVSGVFER